MGQGIVYTITLRHQRPKKPNLVYTRAPQRLTKVVSSKDAVGSGGGLLVGATSPFAASREAVLRLTLDAGKYVLVPMTYAPDTGGRYWLSVMASVEVELHDESEVRVPWRCDVAEA